MSQSYSVTKIKPLPLATVQYLNGVDKENDPSPHYETIGGILFDTKYIWTSNGSRFTVINSKTGFKVAAWNFGLVVKDYSLKVVCVDELSRPTGKLPLLVIGLESTNSGGMICIFDITGSRVLRAIQIVDKVSSLHVIHASYDKCPLPGPLRAFDGILSIGTAGGNVLLLDICRHTCDEVLSGSCLGDIRDEINSCSVKTLFFDDIYSLELYKQVAIRNGEHLAIHLNATENNVTPHFILKGPKGEDRVHVNKAEVIISALHYCPQLGSLLVGYNFGAWQLWNLIDLQLVYTSPIYEENVPVAHFAIQEPCDDPRAFCYVWVVYSNTEPYHTSFPLAVLYSLNYDTKEWHEGYGILYQDLTSCSVRFQADLTLLNEIDTDNVRQGAYCLRLQSINKSISKGGTLQEFQEETVSLCSIVWSGWSAKSNVIHTFLSLFDLNQWYKEQMPNSPRFKECGTYMTHICLSRLLPAANSEPTPFLDVRMDLNTLSQFFGSHRLEEHYYPTSLAFKMCAFRKNDIVLFNNQGSQRALLSHLESSGPSVLLNPTELFQQSINLGLYPLFIDVPHNVSLDDQRELILSVALEQQLLGWLCRCVSVWSVGSYSTAGCTLQFLLSWGWQRALVLKQNADKLSTPLFDYSGLRLDANNHNLLSNCARQLKNLSTFFGHIVKRFARFLLHPDVVKEQWESLQMVSVHLEVLQWLLNVGLLPECPILSYPRADEFNRISAPYPVDSLMIYYDERRTYLQNINKEHFSTSGSLLFIDNLIELECGGQKVQKQWKEDDGNGLYPPPSLQALLRTYLTEGVEISFKHCIVVYVFLDLAMTLDQSRYKPIITHLIKFPAVFQLSPSIIKITQAFWQLDHGDFSTAMEQLLDPLVCAEDLKIWHHRVALRALLAQNQHKFALLYLQVRQPAVTEVEDLCTVLSLFIANNMLDEAFHFQRQNRSIKNEEKLLQHFYQECDKKDDISSIIHLPLIQTEEEAFMKYLQDVNHPKLQDLQIFYYIQRSQYVDAFKLNDKHNVTKHSTKGLKGQDNIGFRDLMVNEFTETLPEISKSLMKFCQQENPTQWKEVTRPEPFSVFVHNTNEQAKYKSTIINTVLSKAKETWTHPVLNTTLKEDSIIHSITEEMPFLNTPKAMHSASRITTSVIFPKITTLVETGHEEDGPSPLKRFKPSPRLSVSTEKQRTAKQLNNVDVTCNTLSVKLDTPIIKRKISKRSSMGLRYSDEKFSAGTPQSILKVYNLVRNSRSPDSGTPENKNITRDSSASTPAARETKTSTNKLGTLSRKTSFGLTPRKPLPRTPRHGVRFDISRGSSESSLTSEPSFEIVHDEAMIHSSLEGIKKRVSELKANTSQQSISEVNSKNSSLSADESFYSPDASISSNTDSKPTSVLQSIVEIDESKVLNQQVSKELININSTRESKVLKDSDTGSPRLTKSFTRHIEDASVAKTGKATDEIVAISESMKTEITPSMPSSPKTPKSRRSYRGSLPEVGIRSSPRLRKSLLQTPSEQQQTKKEILVEMPQLQSKATSQIVETSESLTEESTYTPASEISLRSKLKGRRPLSRQVLENNTFSKMVESSIIQQKSLLSSSQSQLEISYSKTETTFESKQTVELSEECKEISTLNIELDTANDLPIHEHEDSEIISSHSKLDDTKSTLDMDSANVSYDQLDIAYVSDTMLQPSTSFFKIEENSIQSDRDVSISPLEQVTDNDDKDLQEKADEVEVCDKNNEEASRISNDQQDFSEEEENEIVSRKDTENKVVCDSDADTVVIESDLLADTANIYEDLSSDNNYGSTDPQMNVFEISDDLDLNEGICVGKNVDILEIDTNYTTSANDEVFADKSEVLTDVVAVNENSLEQFESSKAYECNKNIQDINSITQSEEVEKERIDENEVIELSSSEENDDAGRSDRNLESSDTENSDNSPLNSSFEEQYVYNEEVMYEENSDSERSHASGDQLMPDHSEQDLGNEQNNVSYKEVLSESESSENSEIASDNTSREPYSSEEYSVELAGECEEINEEQEGAVTAECSNNDVEELSNEITSDISEEAVNIGQLDVIPEEDSNVCSESSQVDVSPKSKDDVKFTAEGTHTDLISVETATKESDTVYKTDIVDDCQLDIIPATKESDTVCKTDIVDDCQLDIIPEETSDMSITHAHLTIIPEETSGGDVEPAAVSTSEKVSDSESTKIESSNAPIGLINESVDIQTSSTIKNSYTVAQQTVIEMQHENDQIISKESKKLSTESDINPTDILDRTQSIESTSNIAQDALNQSKTYEKTPGFKDYKSRDWLNQTDILDATGRQSTIYVCNSTNDNSDFNQSSLNVTSSDTPATTDILEKSQFLKSKESLNYVLNQTDFLDRTTSSFEKKSEELQEDNVNDLSQLCDEVFKENLEKSSTPARRSRRLSSLQPITPSDQLPIRRTRRSASFNIPQNIEVISTPSTSKDSTPVKRTEIARAQVVTPPRKKRSTANTDVKEMPLQKRLLRSSSTDVEVKKNETKSSVNTKNRRASSVHIDLPVIKEESKLSKSEKENKATSTKKSRADKQDSKNKSSLSESGRKQKTVKQPRKSKSTITAVANKNKIEEYSSTRRLTRRQAVLLKKTLGASEMALDLFQLQEHGASDSEDSEKDERGPNMSKIDPIHLLDKPSFEGKRDSDEEKNIQQSPSSSVPESPISSRGTRRLRSRSSLSNTSPRSEVSTVPSVSEASVSTKRKHDVKHPVSVISTRAKQRSKSVDEGPNQTKEMPSPPKLRKTRGGSKEPDSGSDISSVSKSRSLVAIKKSNVTRRTRAASVQLDETGQVESPLRKSERRSLLAKSDLPQIIEEQNSTSADTKPKASKRNVRKGSSAK